MYLLIVCHFDQECLVEPLGALYGGGIIVNSEFNHNIEGLMGIIWTGKIEEIKGRKQVHIVAHSRKNPSDSFSQNVHVEEGKIYRFSGN